MWDPKITLVETLDEALAFRRWLGERRPILGLDTETQGLHWWEPHFLRTTQFGDGEQAWVIPQEWYGKLVKDSIESYDGPIVGHNIKFEMHALAGAGIKLNPAQLHDSKIAAWMLNPADKTKNALKSLATKHVATWAGYPEYLKDKYFRTNKVNWATCPVDAVPYWFYGGLDPIITCKLWEKVGHYSTTEAYQQEMALLPIIWRAERAGMRIDLDYISKMRTEWAVEMIELKARCQEYGLNNPASNVQIEASLKGEGWEPEDFTATGRAKLNKTILAGIPHELGDLVIQYKRLQKWDSSYLKNFQRMADGDLLHGSINQLEARTGRMSVTQPALQTIPRGPVIRDCFIAEEGSSLWAIDYAGVEARLFAHYSEDEDYRQVFRDGLDPHTYTAQQVFGVEKPTPQQRQIAKNVTFALLYGAGADKIAETAGIPVDEADTFMSFYHGKFPAAQRLMDRVIGVGEARLAQEGRAYIRLYNGIELPADDDGVYALTNYLIQGSSALVLKKAMLDLDTAGYGEFIRMPIHDELVLQIPNGNVDFLPEICAIMEDSETYTVPLACEVSGPLKRWGDKYGKDS